MDFEWQGWLQNLSGLEIFSSWISYTEQEIIWKVFVCVCVWLDLSRFVGIEKHREISGDAYVSLLHSSANKAIGNYWS